MIVVDTNVVSYLEKGHPWAALYRPHLAGRVAVLSFQTIAELKTWAAVRGWSAERSARLEAFLRESFTMAPHDEALNDRFAAAKASAQLAGRRIETGDAWIAATALELGAPLVTHNPSDFAGVDGLEVVSEAA